MKIWAALMKSRHVMLLCALTLMCSVAWAQNDRGAMAGRVTDPSGAVVPHAKLVANEVATGVKYTAAASDTGVFILASLPAGTYNLTVTATGFKTYLQAGITINVALTASMNVVLQVGAATETVTVTADAPLLQTEDAQVSTSISRQALEELPISWGGALRDAEAFYKLTPGATDLGSNGGYIKIDGMPVASQKLVIDGQDATGDNVVDQDYGTQRPAVDAMQELTLESNNFNAEFSQVSGGLFNFTSRSGTNDLHGSAYENWQNDFLNADTPFATGAPNYLSRRLLNHQNDYGFSVGGPVWLPKLYNGRNKTFFFFNWEQYRQSNASVITLSVPTAKMRTGDFSEILGTVSLGTDACGNTIYQNAIYDQTNTQVCNGQTVPTAYANNKITTTLDPEALKIQSLIPNPTNSSVNGNYVQTVAYPSTNTDPSFKIDQVITNKWKLSFYWSRFSLGGYWTYDPLPAPITTTRPAEEYNTMWRLNSDYQISDTMFLHLGGGFLRTKNADAGILPNYDPSQLGMPTTYTPGVPQFMFSTTNEGYSQYQGFGGMVGKGNGYDIGGELVSSWRPAKTTGVGSLTWVRGSHTYKVGGEYKDDVWDMNTGSPGHYNFSGAETAIPYLQSVTVTNPVTQASGAIGFPYASFLLGKVDGGNVESPVTNEWRRPYYGFYGQDTWKVNSKLTLNYGLRWEYTVPMFEHLGRVSGFSPATPNPNAGGLPGAMIYEGNAAGGCNCNFMKGYKNAYGPRLGFAYQLDPKTVLRGGWGTVYGQGTTMDYIGSNVKEVGVGFNTLTFSPSAFGVPNTTLAQGFALTEAQLTSASRDPGLGVTAGSIQSPPSPWFDPDGARPNRVQNWNIGIQRQLTSAMAVEVAYVGNRGVWETSGDNGHIGMNELNSNSLQRLGHFGLDPSVPANLTLLNSTFASGLPQAAGFNIPYAGFPMGATLAQALRPFPQFGDVYSQFSPNGKSWYDALQAKLTSRASHGLMLMAAFTWSKSEALGQDYRGRYEAINDSFNVPANKTISWEDQPITYALAFTYQIPIPAAFRTNQLSKAVLGGWQLGGIQRFGSGFPIGTPGSLNNLYNVTFNGGGTYANKVQGQPLFLTNPNSRFDIFNQTIFNMAAWQDAAPGTYGTTNPVMGGAFRWQRNHDEEANLAKNFKMGERVSLQLRAEFFNLFNRLSFSNWEQPNSYLGTPTYMTVNGQQVLNPSGFGNVYPTNPGGPNAMRQGQLVGRITF